PSFPPSADFWPASLIPASISRTREPLSWITSTGAWKTGPKNEPLLLLKRHNNNVARPRGSDEAEPEQPLENPRSHSMAKTTTQAPCRPVTHGTCTLRFDSGGLEDSLDHGAAL